MEGQQSIDDAVYYNYAAHDDDFYGLDDDRRRALRKVEDMDASHSMTAVETKKVSGDNMN